MSLGAAEGFQRPVITFNTVLLNANSAIVGKERILFVAVDVVLARLRFPHNLRHF